MPTNHVSLVFNAERIAAIAGLLTSLETELVDLISMSAAEHRGLFKMGDKSEVFCRETLGVLQQNPKLVPESLNLAEAQADLDALDALRPVLRRLEQLTARAQSTELALGADVFSAALEGYGLLKVSGKHHGLEGKRRELGNRFGKSPRVQKEAEPA